MTSKHPSQNAETKTIRLSAVSSAFVADLLTNAKPIPAIHKARKRHEALIAKG